MFEDISMLNDLLDVQLDILSDPDSPDLLHAYEAFLGFILQGHYFASESAVLYKELVEMLIITIADRKASYYRKGNATHILKAIVFGRMEIWSFDEEATEELSPIDNYIYACINS